MVCDKEYFRKKQAIYRAANLELCRERCRKWHVKNREKQRAKAAAKRAANREAYNRAAREAYKKYPLQNKARRAVRTALKQGKLVKPTTCPACGTGNIKSKDMHAHHADHTKPLEIQWLCITCHAELRKIKAQA